MPSAGSLDYLIAATISAISLIEVDRFPSIQMLRFGKFGKVTTVLSTVCMLAVWKYRRSGTAHNYYRLNSATSDDSA
jgi:hypothetical protein